MTSEQLAEIEARANRLANPWTMSIPMRINISAAMIDFIGKAKEDIPALIAAVRERDERIAELKDVLAFVLDAAMLPICDSNDIVIERINEALK